MAEKPQMIVCQEHSGFKAEIGHLRTDVKELKSKWGAFQKWLFIMLGGVLLNLLLMVINMTNGG